MNLPLNLLEKIKLLLKITLLKFGLTRIVWTAKRIPLNEYSRELLNTVRFESSGLFQYKKISDPTGEWRFFIPSFDDSAVYRIDTKHGRKSKLPDELNIVARLNGRIDEERYKKVWEEGQTIFDDRFTTNP